MSWKTINKLNVATIENSELLLFQINKENDCFRMVNDYGNNSFTFDIMTGYEAISRIKESIEAVINQELEHSFRKQKHENESDHLDLITPDSLDSKDRSNDCQGDLNG